MIAEFVVILKTADNSLNMAMLRQNMAKLNSQYLQH